MELNKFKPNEVFNGKPFSCIMNATRNSGKSYLLKHFYEKYLKHNYDLFIVFCKTLKNGQYDYLDTKMKYHDYDENVIKTLTKVKKFNIKACIIFDDVLSLKNRYNKTLGDLFYSGRHHNLSPIYLVQKCSFLDNGWINNCTVFITLRNVSLIEKKTIAEKILLDHMINIYPNLSKSTNINKCVALLNKYTRNHGAVICTPLKMVSCSVPDDKIYKELIFHYKA